MMEFLSNDDVILRFCPTNIHLYLSRDSDDDNSLSIAPLLTILHNVPHSFNVNSTTSKPLPY